MSKGRFLKPLQEFLTSKSDFSIIYNTSTTGSTSSFINPTTQRVCILDSSFNPPHLGHYALIEESLTKNYDNIPITNKVVLLLLSVKNADKLHPKPESFDKRLDMMYLMANDLSKKYPVNIAIGLTNHAKFVDKSLSVLNYIKETQNHHQERNLIKLTFLVGFDTLIRIFDPKYYLPDKLSNSLENFMKNTDLFCLTRLDNSFSQLEQSKYIDDIKRGDHEEIPSHWSDNIYLLPPKKEIEINQRGGEINQEIDVATISSSSIRKQIEIGDHPDGKTWKSQVLPDIANYIIKEDLYKQS
ncbi:hypothetical protein MG5_01281 [Candida albicans P57072]|uniref:Nicotinamide-nucleotide adenylyltransferase n=4 Tax=Candida albicans TaxID=5476 RepID=Q5AL24_CANAL|nr:nicotinamide-nucleotide adenylyltransferase [Candida albicans SC5314]EEQ41934.1 conserved hypothetical protein [Candida albicans WO-1]KAF6069497.1 hypothetical protein FOB64_003142 [Candida albicans]KGQ90968.1 hypothetical protein MEO_01287 [Candida albicans P94015]KGQ97475.1 hypothetical protein MEU_01288 [Candida albicans P37005]KGR03046.1 hypothetical protein MG1_01293 [Candida albicans GC75]KGR14541.1 hypothetical protein MG5_01281 [Candida albicans P57072]KGR16607.1 hypothetical prot|eukprot:XP_722164.1 nicotinamide-nucleotide adenylyltransferase [Candida albicans SC5314]